MQSRLRIPLLFGLDVIHGMRTIYPIPLGEAASFDLDLMKRTAAGAAREASAQGVHWTFAPMMDISRDARWGRVMEGAGEDTWYGTLVARARIEGFQGESLADVSTVMACAKHFAAYGPVLQVRIIIRWISRRLRFMKPIYLLSRLRLKAVLPPL